MGGGAHRKPSEVGAAPLFTPKAVAVWGDDCDHPDVRFWSPCSSNFFIFHFLIMTTEVIVPILKK